MATSGDRKPVTTYLDPEDREKMEKLADANDRNLSAEIRRAVKFYLRDMEERGMT